MTVITPAPYRHQTGPIIDTSEQAKMTQWVLTLNLTLFPAPCLTYYLHKDFLSQSPWQHQPQESKHRRELLVREARRGWWKLSSIGWSDGESVRQAVLRKAAKTFSQPISQGEVYQPLAREFNPARRRCVSQEDVHCQISIKPQVASLESWEKTAGGCSVFRVYFPNLKIIVVNENKLLRQV